MTVGVLGAPVGLRGYVSLELRTDSVRERFSKGTVLRTDPANAGPLTVVGLRKQGGRVVAAFVEVTTREQAAALAGVHLVVDEADTSEDDAYYPHQLRGLEVVDPKGGHLGVVSDLILGQFQDLLEIDLGERLVLVPFVRQIVTSVDVEAGVVVVDAPDGLVQVDDAD